MRTAFIFRIFLADYPVLGRRGLGPRSLADRLGVETIVASFLLSERCWRCVAAKATADEVQDDNQLNPYEGDDSKHLHPARGAGGPIAAGTHAAAAPGSGGRGP